MKIVSLAMLVTTTLFLSACGGPERVGSINGQDVTRAEFDAYLQLKNIPKDNAERVERALDVFMERRALAAAIEKSAELNPAQIAAEVDEFKNQMLISRFFDSHLNALVSEEAIRDYYTNHLDQYQRRKVHVSHILLRVDPGMDETQRKAILTSAHEIYSKLQSGESFSEVARALSEDKVSAEKGGDLGWINEGAVAPEFSEKAFSMETGTLSEPFLTAFGYHILRVDESPQIVTQPLDALKGDIRYQLRNDARQAEVKRLLKTVKMVKGA